MIWPLLVLSPLHFLCDVAGLSGSQQHCAIEVCIFEHVPNDGVLTAETVGVIVILVFLFHRSACRGVSGIGSHFPP